VPRHLELSKLVGGEPFLLFCHAILKYSFSDYALKFFNFLYFPMKCYFIALIPSFLFVVNCSHKLEYIKLKKWLKGRGFEDSNLRPAEFWGNVLIFIGGTNF